MKPHVLAAALFGINFALVAAAHADIPAGYAGTPFKGTPTPLPGRVDFENFDLGGYNVGFKTEHHLAGAPIGCSGGDYRTDADQPTMCKTNQGTEVDKYADGTLYPSATNTVSYYVGAVRPSDWIQLTVNVKTAGTYKLSSTFASDADKIDLTLQLNGVEKLHYTTNAGGGYHKWVPAPQFAEVQLDAGVQVLKLICNREHVNADYIQFSRVTATGLDDGDTSVGGAGNGGAGAAGAASAGASGAESAGSGGTGIAGDSAGGASAAGANAAAGSSAAGASSVPGAGASGMSSSAGAPTAITPGGNSPATDSGCGCRMAAPVSSRAAHGLWLAALASALAFARRRCRTYE